MQIKALRVNVFLGAFCTPQNALSNSNKNYFQKELGTAEKQMSFEEIAIVFPKNFESIPVITDYSDFKAPNEQLTMGVTRRG